MNAQAQLEANPGYVITCVEYIVSGNYAIKVRASDGSYTFESGSSTTATIVRSGCSAEAAGTAVVEAITEYSAGFSGTKIVLGYSATYRSTSAICSVPLQRFQSLPTMLHARFFGAWGC
jgi:hypothetical protein